MRLCTQRVCGTGKFEDKSLVPAVLEAQAKIFVLTNIFSSIILRVMLDRNQCPVGNERYLETVKTHLAFFICDS